MGIFRSLRRRARSTVHRNTTLIKYYKNPLKRCYTCCSVIGEFYDPTKKLTKNINSSAATHPEFKMLTKLKFPFKESKPQERTRYERTAVKTPFQVIVLSFVRSYWCDKRVKLVSRIKFSLKNTRYFKA